MSVFLRVTSRGERRTYPLTAFDHISHTKSGRVYIEVGGYPYTVVERATHKECLAVEDAILRCIAGPWGSDLRIIDVSEIADHALIAYRGPPDVSDYCVGCEHWTGECMCPQGGVCHPEESDGGDAP